MSDISLGRFRGGYCVYWWSNGKRRRYQLKAGSLKEAQVEARDVYRQRTQQATNGATIDDCWRAYRDSLGDRPTARTLDYTGKAVLAAFGHYRPDQVTDELFRNYTKGRNAEGRSIGTVHTELGHLRSALRYARRIKMISHAPEIWRPSKPETDKRILNPGEARSLIDATHDPHIRLAVVLLLGTAARVGAILDLTWDRVDFERGAINLRLPDSATRKGRAHVPMNGMTRAALQTAHDAALSDYVVEYAGRQIKSIRKGFMGAVERSGIGHVRIHDLRHTAAVTMLSNGVPLEMVSQALGHSNTSITFKTYARYLPEHLSPAMNVLDFTKARSVG